MKEYVLLTGATGYIGAGLLRKWLKEGKGNLVLLVREKRGESPGKRIDGVLAELYAGHLPDPARFAGRIEVHRGDVSRERLGLEEKEYTELAGRISRIIHCAAAARFDLDLEEARRTNLGGTRNILDFAGKCNRLKKVDYVGTAYVAGKRKGVIREDELDAGQEHNNTYEASKMEAEKLVRSKMSELPLSIFRPSIVISDSETGRASSFNGFYRALKMYWLGLLKIIPGYPESVMDLVPVDYVTEAMFRIAYSAESVGKCFHLTAGPDNATTLGEIRDLAGKHFRKEPFDLVPPGDFEDYVQKYKMNLPEGGIRMMDEIVLYLPYLAGELRFDNANTVRLAPLKVPPVRQYFGKMAEYIMRRTPLAD
ncbi:MAG: SDR family oxidoreductase [Candidatus Krumholzibacteriota bacterium]|nr:SDR family oxidoreductase [Candidatus Krumholzibacteriota bacterium]